MSKPKGARGTGTKVSVKGDLTRPVGTPPAARVFARHGGVLSERAGRGFSLEELKEVGLAPKVARTWGLLVDDRRKSVLEMNVTSAKAFVGHATKPREPESGAAKLEKGLSRLGKEAKEEVAEAKKDIVKEGKKVEKKTAKAAKQVEESIEKPLKTKAKKKPSKSKG